MSRGSASEALSRCRADERAIDLGQPGSSRAGHRAAEALRHRFDDAELTAQVRVAQARVVAAEAEVRRAARGLDLEHVLRVSERPALVVNCYPMGLQGPTSMAAAN